MEGHSGTQGEAMKALCQPPETIAAPAEKTEIVLATDAEPADEVPALKKDEGTGV
jgi:hypothetical protein